ncbi:MAG TPA: PAS domain S-box protein [Dissulfurispiraceae bacterium]|nr:PAS domain S-box protein [Dissulfurispiraceae bacterium]
MTNSSDPKFRDAELRDRIAGLGEQSIRKSYYPELQQRIADLERYRMLLEQSSDIILLLSVPSGQILECNESACRDLGYSRDTLCALTLFTLMTPSAAEHAARLFADAQKGALKRETFAGTFTTAGGGSFPIELSLKIVNLDQSLFAVADARNIEERLRAEHDLKVSEERYRSLFEESRDAIYMSLPNGDFIDINQAGIEMLGYRSKDEVLQLNMERDIYADPTARRQAIQRLMNDEYLKDYEVQLRRKNGECLDVLLTSSMMHDEQGCIVGYRGIMHDITGRKKLEQQLLHSQKMEAIGRLTAGIAHDFNNILTAILGYATILELKMTGEGHMKQYVNNIITSSERAAALIKRLLSFSSRRALSRNSLDLNSIVKATADLIVEVIGKDITLEILPAAQPLIINADKSQVEQIIMNLVVNARDAMPQGGTLRIQSEPYLLSDDFIRQHGYGKPGEYALLSVADTGTGMDSEVLQKLFEPFFTTKKVGKGTGLGLSIVYGIMKQHDGFINVESAPGAGATFRLYLPTFKLDDAPATRQASPE